MFDYTNSIANYSLVNYVIKKKNSKFKNIIDNMSEFYNILTFCKIIGKIKIFYIICMNQSIKKWTDFKTFQLFFKLFMYALINFILIYNPINIVICKYVGTIIINNKNKIFC